MLLNFFKKLLPILFFVLFFCVSLPCLAEQSNKKIDVLLFMQQGCPHCAKAEKQLSQWQKSVYPQIKLHKYDIIEQKNLQYFIITSQAYDFSSRGVPTLFIGERAIEGANIKKIESAIKNCLEKACPSPEMIINSYLKRQNQTAEADSDQNTQKTNQNKGGLIILGIVAAAIIGISVFININKRK
jgi:glutaredoxin